MEASHFTTFRRIYLPIMTPVLAALLILDFVATWNEFAMALVTLQAPDKWTLPLGPMAFQGQFSNDYGQLNSAIIITVIPAVLVYLIFQRYFVSGLTSGAVKGWQYADRIYGLGENGGGTNSAVSEEAMHYRPTCAMRQLRLLKEQFTRL